MICTRCKNLHDGNTKYCKNCLSYFKKLRQNRVDTNRCERCGAPLNNDVDSGHIKCMNCRQYRTI